MSLETTREGLCGGWQQVKLNQNFPPTMKLAPLGLLVLVICWLFALTSSSLRAGDHPVEAYPALAKATVLIIRHAEKPDHGDGLSPAGQARAAAYVNYFEHYQINGVPIALSALFAAADSHASHRPSLTLAPLSQASGLPIDSQYKDHDYLKLVGALQTTGHGQDLLVCWHQGKIPDLVRALGADPNALLPDGNWPNDEYGWVIQLRYNKAGQLKSAERIVENF